MAKEGTAHVLLTDLGFEDSFLSVLGPLDLERLDAELDLAELCRLALVDPATHHRNMSPQEHTDLRKRKRTQ